MRILVTGGFGYLGSHTSDYFLNKGHAVRILSRTRHPELSGWSKQFEVVTGDVSEFPSIEDCCKGIDVVIHTAALNEVECRTKTREALLVNGYGTRNLLEEAHRNRVNRFIYYSTFHVYGIPQTSVISEQTLPSPVNDYAITHYLAELYCHQFEAENKVNTYILRISNGYGAPLFKSVNRWTLVVNELCAMAFSEKRIKLRSKGTQERDFVAVSDILRGVEIFALNDVASENGNNVYNLGGENNVSILSIAGAVAEVYKERYRNDLPVQVPENAAQPDVAMSFKFSIDRMRKLGYRPSAVMKNEIHKVFELLEKG